MKTIFNANDTVLSVLKRFLKFDGCTRWLQYCVHTPVENGMLVFNSLTRELIFLSNEEYGNYANLDYLKKRWFVVPDETREKDFADLVKLVFRNCEVKSKEITGYTIFPTTDCNARCFYCFELGRSRMPMSNETAKKVVNYIKNHRGDKKVNLSWFGGEPLYNIAAIETICNGLRQECVEFTSRMVSNGYLFDDDVVRKAKYDWNVTHVQITLDGTENVYNKTKAFIYKDSNPYKVVMANIGRLLDAGIYVSVRLNMDLYNADDLLVLAKELTHCFGGNEFFSVYAHHLFKTDVPLAEMHTDDEWEKRDNAMRRLTDCLIENGIAARAGVTKHIKTFFCKADSGRAVTILPDGNVGLCEHFSESEFAGNLDQAELDPKTVALWKETMPELPECADCFYYLDCVKIKKCPNGSDCYKQHRQERLRNVQNRMLWTYECWQNETPYGDINENDDC